MITCPWCGTNYAEFQPNCKNCGGQLPAAPPPERQVVNVNILAGDFIDYQPEAPPPAPRQISNSYIWRLLGSDGGAIAGMVFLFIGVIFTVIGIPLSFAIVTAFVGIPFGLLGIVMSVVSGITLYNRFQKMNHTVEVLKNGEAVLGRIMQLGQNTSVQINGRNPWRIDYQFQINGRNYQGEVSTLSPPYHLRPGMQSYILFLPEAPNYNALYPHP